MALEAELIELLSVFAVAVAVGIFVEKFGDFPYTIALLIAGVTASLFGIQFDVELSHDIILFGLLPLLVFEGAATTDFEAFKRDMSFITALAIPGLIISVILLGTIATMFFDLPIFIALLFASIIMPTDPVSVLALFDDIGAPERLSILVEGESLINDGVGVVLFTTLLEIVTSGATVSEVLTPLELLGVTRSITVSVIGGILVGGIMGYAVYSIMRDLDEHKTEIALTLLLTYSSFLVAEHYFHVSGVVAAVAAGLFLGNRGAENAMSAQTRVSIFNTLDTGAFLVNTFIFVTIGITTPTKDIVTHADSIVPAILFVLIARAVVVYPITNVLNIFNERKISLDYQHVMFWGGLHASIPIALVLGLPSDLPHYTQIKVMVFGVAAFSLIVQGLSMERLVNSLGIATQSQEERLYELLLGRARALDAVLDMDLPSSLAESHLYENKIQEYQREKEQLNRAISALLSKHPELKSREEQVFERQLLAREKSEIRDAEKEGRISSTVSERLQEEVDIKLDKVRHGESTLEGEEEGYKEFWKNEVENVLGEKVYEENPEKDDEN